MIAALRSFATLARLEIERGRVDAVAQAGRLGTVGEDVAQMRVADPADDLGAPIGALSAVSQKAGQPLPLSYLWALSKRMASQQTQRYSPSPL